MSKKTVSKFVEAALEYAMIRLHVQICPECRKKYVSMLECIRAKATTAAIEDESFKKARVVTSS